MADKSWANTPELLKLFAEAVAFDAANDDILVAVLSSEASTRTFVATKRLINGEDLFLISFLI